MNKPYWFGWCRRSRISGAVSIRSSQPRSGPRCWKRPPGRWSFRLRGPELRHWSCPVVIKAGRGNDGE